MIDNKAATGVQKSGIIRRVQAVMNSASTTPTTNTTTLQTSISDTINSSITSSVTSSQPSSTITVQAGIKPSLPKGAFPSGASTKQISTPNVPPAQRPTGVLRPLRPGISPRPVGLLKPTASPRYI